MRDNEAGKKVPSSADSGCCRVDRKLVPIKLLLFLFSGGSHSFLAYRSLFYKHLGFASTQVGLFYLIEALFASAVVPAVAWTADCLHRPRLFVIATLIVGSLSDLAQFNIPYAAGVPGFVAMNTNQTQTSMIIHAAPGIYKPGDSFTPAQAHLDGAEANSTSRSCIVADVYPSGTASNCTGAETNLSALTACVNVTCTFTSAPASHGVRPNEPRAEKALFVHAMVLVMTSSLGHFAAASLIQSLMMNLLKQHDAASGRHDDDAKSRYGRQLMWGAVGSGVFMWTVGALKDVVANARGKEDKFMFAPMFLCSSVLMMSAALVAWQLRYDRSDEAATKNGDRIRLCDIKEVMVRPRTVMFLLVLLVYGIDQAIVQGFVFWFGESKLQASGTILGASALVGNVAVLPFFACADDVIRRCGAELVLVGAMFAFAARFYLYTIASAGWQMIPMELFRVVTYSLAYTAACTYARSLAPPGGEATTMAIVYVVIKTIGCGAGSAMGGVIFSSYDGDFLFRSASLLSLVAALVYGVYVLVDGAMTRRRRRRGGYLDDEMTLRQGDDKMERVELCQFPTGNFHEPQ